ncbi:MAG: hypothetical protein LBV79_10375, partial [Candidatus Adiutrix sp.]|nr:hypothetical protein [Candidatus Adiutrix sp.]
MAGFLHIQARLPRAAGLEFSARLLAVHPAWDIELEEDGLNFVLPISGDGAEAALAEVDELARAIEKTRFGLTVELEAAECAEFPARPAPVAAGPWRLRPLAEGESPPPPRPDQLLLPPGARASKKFWAGEALLLT